MTFRLWLVHRLGCIEECGLAPFENALVTAIGGFLAADAEWSPWHRLPVPPADFLVAVHAGAEAVIVDSSQRQLNVAANRGFASQTGDRDFPLRLVVDLLGHISAAFAMLSKLRDLADSSTCFVLNTSRKLAIAVFCHVSCLALFSFVPHQTKVADCSCSFGCYFFQPGSEYSV